MDGFVDTPAGFVPRADTAMGACDWLGSVAIRLGVGRHDYKVTPGLYCVGDPLPESPVIVTANYKLTFDAVRRELFGVDAWLLVCDTRGINVWCAAGNGLFSTDEVVQSVRAARLEAVVDHRELVLPQLSATGVAAHEIKRKSGFRVHFGPVRAGDLPAYLKGGKRADDAMRQVTFTAVERAVLAPVELCQAWKLFGALLLAGFLLSGIGPGFFSAGAAWARGQIVGAATFFGILGGGLAVPLLLPVLPGRQFWIKGVGPGAVAGFSTIWLFWGRMGGMECAAVFLWALAVSSCLAMNFTGSTPFTSPTGVEYEMRRGMPVQAGGALLAVILWIAAALAG